ncbi:MAG: lipid biosynthesis B12-binding/radical SAM protein [Desulfobacterales bacterium]
MKVLLVSANTLTQPYPVYPLGLDYVAGAIADRHQVRILDMNAEDDENVLFTAIDGFAPDVIGMSIRNVDTTDASNPKGFFAGYKELTADMRACSSAVVVLGGSGFTIFPGETMRALGADYGIIGEGERLAPLLEALEGRRYAASIPGVITQHSPVVFPSPWPNGIVRKFDPQLPHLGYYLENGGMLNLQTKRGCGFNCIYCTYPHIEGHRMRLFDPREVADTARRLQEAGARYFFVTDSAFNANAEHSLAVAQAFKKSGVSIPWGAFFAPVTPVGDYYRILADAGLTHVEFGTESLSDAVLKAYRKPFRVGQVFEAHAAAVAAGLYVAHYILLGGPGETPATMVETLERLERLDKCALFFFCGMRIYPQTDLYEMACRDGQIQASGNILEPLFYRSPEIGGREIMTRVQERAGGRLNWIIGDGGEQTAGVISKMHARGYSGPLWELCIR